MAGLPAGWDLDRIRALEPLSDLLDPSSHDVFYGDGNDLAEMEPEFIVNFSGLCLVRVKGDDGWYMGNLDQQDGSIVCWGPYGPDLEHAIRSL